MPHNRTRASLMHVVNAWVGLNEGPPQPSKASPTSAPKAPIALKDTHPCTRTHFVHYLGWRLHARTRGCS
eukprot:53261-Eustigmatos_ZCMA.PRE.1